MLSSDLQTAVCLIIRWGAAYVIVATLISRVFT